MPCAPDFSGEHAVDLGVIGGAQWGGADLTRSVHDAGQRRQFGLHGGQQAGDVVGVGDVGGEHADLAALLVHQRVDAPAGRLTRRAAPGQHQMLGAVTGEMIGDGQPYPAEPAGHQICCFRA